MDPSRRQFLFKAAAASGAAFIPSIVVVDVATAKTQVGSRRPPTSQPPPGQHGSQPPTQPTPTNQPNELAYTGDDSTNLIAGGLAATAAGAALMALGHEEPDEA